MSQLRLSPFVDDHLSDMALVTGIPRSGTTIVGKTIGTFTDVEYAFEPPLVPYINAHLRHKEIPKERAVDTLRAYLHFDYFANYVQGRKYNFRPSDASCVLKMKSIPHVVERWSTSGRTRDAMKRSQQPLFAFKSPGAYNVAAALADRYPDIRIIDLSRSLRRVVASLSAKGWFDDDQLHADTTALWPFHDVDREYMVPYHVSPADTDRWQTMNAATRIVYICNQIAESKLAFRETIDDDQYHEIAYETFVEETEQTVSRLAAFLNRDFGVKTEAVVETVAPTDPPAPIDEIMNACDETEAERFKRLDDQVDA